MRAIVRGRRATGLFVGSLCALFGVREGGLLPFRVRFMVVIACHCSESDTLPSDPFHCSLSGSLPPVVHHCSVPDPLLSLNAIVGFGPKPVPASCEPLFSQTLCQRIHAIVILRPFPASCPSLLSAKSFAVVECHYSASNTFLPVSDHCWASDRGFFFHYSPWFNSQPFAASCLSLFSAISFAVVECHRSA